MHSPAAGFSWQVKSRRSNLKKKKSTKGSRHRGRLRALINVRRSNINTKAPLCRRSAKKTRKDGVSGNGGPKAVARGPVKANPPYKADSTDESRKKI